MRNYKSVLSTSNGMLATPSQRLSRIFSSPSEAERQTVLAPATFIFQP